MTADKGVITKATTNANANTEAIADKGNGEMLKAEVTDFHWRTRKWSVEETRIGRHIDIVQSVVVMNEDLKKRWDVGHVEIPALREGGTHAVFSRWSECKSAALGARREMKALVLTAFGGPENLEMRKIPKPEVRPGTLLIKVAATSVNSLDIKIREGGLAICPDLPAVLGSDVAGTVEEVGEGSVGFSIGDEVYGFAGGIKGYPGTMSEYVVADANLMALKPRTLSMREAAALPHVSVTALQALHRASVFASDHILIHGGTDGVGHVGIQIAKSLGCKIATTICANEDAELVRALGATEVINVREESVDAYVQRLTYGAGFDVIFDTLGGDNLTHSLQATKANGRVVTTNAHVTIDLTAAHVKALSLLVVFVMLPIINGIGRKSHGDALRSIAILADSGRLRPLIDDQSFTLEGGADAQRRMQSGKARGKVVIDVM